MPTDLTRDDPFASLLARGLQIVRAEPQGGQFALGGGRVGAKPAQQKQQRKKAAPGSVLGYNPKTGQGTGYGSKNGDSRVRSLQEALNKLGLTDGNGKPLKLDGKLGPKTTSAIKKLQEQLGMTPNGRVTPLFLSKITGAESVDSLKANLRKPKPAERSAFIRALGVALLPEQDHVRRHGTHNQKDHGRPAVVSKAVGALSGVTDDGKPWTFLREERRDVYGLGEQTRYVIKVGEWERDATGRVHREIRAALDPEFAKEFEADAAKKADEAARIEKHRAENAALREKYERDGVPVFVRFGRVAPGHRSRNSRDNKTEPGLSVYKGYQLPSGAVAIDLRGVDVVSAIFGDFGKRDMYIADGEQIATGSDGEPILDPDTFKLKKAGVDDADMLI